MHCTLILNSNPGTGFPSTLIIPTKVKNPTEKIPVSLLSSQKEVFMALGEIRCEDISNFWSYIYLGSFGASRKREAGTKSGFSTKSTSSLVSGGKRAFGWCMHSCTYMKPATEYKANSYPRSEFFIKRISISWTNNLINPYFKPYNVKNLHGEIFFFCPLE